MNSSLAFVAILLCCCGVTLGQNTTYRPTIIWHGMGDSCCNPFSMGRIKRMIEDEYPGIYVYSVMIGNNVLADTEHGFLGNANNQIQEICDTIRADPQLQEGFDLLGFSQGGQFTRGLVQRCGNISANNLISLGGQHQGIFGLPHCPSKPLKSKFCEYVRRHLYHAAYDNKVIQNRLIQAQYWHDSLNEVAYRLFSIFLSDINNERDINESYRTNMMNLSNFVMVKFLQDNTVIPRETEWFGFYAPGQDTGILTLNQTKLWTEDRLGLQAMNDAGKLQFLGVEGDHLQFSDEWFISEIIQPYLGGVISE